MTGKKGFARAIQDSRASLGFRQFVIGLLWERAKHFVETLNGDY
jgi:hypothetical protein